MHDVRAYIFDFPIVYCFAKYEYVTCTISYEYVGLTALCEM